MDRRGEPHACPRLTIEALWRQLQEPLLAWKGLLGQDSQIGTGGSSLLHNDRRESQTEAQPE